MQVKYKIAHACVDVVSFLSQVFGDESIQLKLEDVKLSDLGEVGEAVITKDDTLLMRGKVIAAIILLLARLVQVKEWSLMSIIE